MSQIQSSPEWGIPNLQVKISWFIAMLLHYCTYIIHTEAQTTFSDQCLSLDIIDLSLEGSWLQGPNKRLDNDE